MAIISPEELEGILVNIIITTLKDYEEILKINKDKDIVALDGKVCNYSKRQSSKNGKVKPVNAMSAFSNRYEIALNTAFISEKSNEIPTGPDIIKKLNLKDVIVTADALNTQRKTAEEIINSKGDYVLALKNNHKNFYDDVKMYFDDEENLLKCDYIKEEEKSHSSLIQYQYFATTDINWLNNKAEWTKLSSIACVIKEVYNLITGEITREERYYISSLKNDIKNITKAIREHWGIENKLHWQLDYIFKEDKSTTFVGNSQKNLNIIRKFCLSLLKLVKENYNKSLAKIQFILGINFENEIPRLINYLNTDKIKKELAKIANSSNL
jgi:predicted transposase YbfD/YdcC